MVHLFVIHPLVHEYKVINKPKSFSEIMLYPYFFVAFPRKSYALASDYSTLPSSVAERNSKLITAIIIYQKQIILFTQINNYN